MENTTRIGLKPPLKPKEVWAIRIRLQLAKRTRELALFNLAIDSKRPRVCQNTHARNGVSKSFAKTRTSVASFGILGVKLETTRLYASSGNGAESFYTGSATNGHWWPTKSPRLNGW